MAEAPDSEPVPSSSKGNLLEDAQDEGPSPKKRKTEGEEIDKLEHRLGGILCCAVCLDLPQAAVYQCSNGHLMCAPCFTHLLADARLRDESASCPNCRIEISKANASRNLAVEKAVSELPSACRHCTGVFPRHSLQHHEDQTCEQRVTGCRYACLGCGWRGAAAAGAAHEAACAHPRQSAADLVELLAARERQAADQLLLHSQLLGLLSYEKITFTDLQLKPYRTEELHKLYYETSRFSAFGQQWLVKAFVNKHQRDPTQSAQREITYQLILKSKPGGAVGVWWMWARGPFGEARMSASLAQHAFREDEAAPARALPLADPADANRLLANKAIHFRLIMFLSPK
ncbi:cysteine and histidine-rich protein 1 homolog isoform X2 [Pararge aegeria]|uniref:cysteine and histidine-rich protein 1 homolog isoform X2 n=1 Tax=Pararge aegeria TaxID=116150 RepID=UPI0019D1FDAB|nr:cysteine and histidine-rich protein 1 homolog isoform X2 [Pararge aegeria]